MSSNDYSCDVLHKLKKHRNTFFWGIVQCTLHSFRGTHVPRLFSKFPIHPRFERGMPLLIVVSMITEGGNDDMEEERKSTGKRKSKSRRRVRMVERKNYMLL